MAEYINGINPEILKWARERSGYTEEAAAKSLNKDEAFIIACESGDRAMTYVQLETLANKYKRPVAMFFFSEPPEEPDIVEKIALRSSDVKKLNPRTLFLFRQAYSRQLSLMELNNSRNPSEDLIFRELKLLTSHNTFNNDNAYKLAGESRAYLDISVERQSSWENEKTALENWRYHIQAKGVFVFKDAFKDDLVDGFCLMHEVFPVIYLNNSRPSVRQIFTLIHELAHILAGKNGITPDIIGSIKIKSADLERFCNQFASEFLVPTNDFKKRVNFSEYDEEEIRKLAKFYNVSRPVILLKLINIGILPQKTYNQKVKLWANQYKSRKRNESVSKGSGGGDYYNTHLTYLGYKYTNLAFEKYYQDLCSIEKLSDHLNVKVRNLENLEDRMLRKATRF
ncbi:MAG: ImmA/IrrE family metallo-endopeptidase [Candidatus Poribacteria bacterium]|nr:ImmA/IrrE family metallo-endopeptidase [Candidatus Poribacteria bacterium]